MTATRSFSSSFCFLKYWTTSLLLTLLIIGSTNNLFADTIESKNMPVTTRGGGGGRDDFASSFGTVENPDEVLQRRSQHANGGELSDEDDPDDPDGPLVVAARLRAEQRGRGRGRQAVYVRMPRPQELVAAQQRGQFVRQLEAQLDEQKEEEQVDDDEDDEFHECLPSDADDDDDSEDFDNDSARESLVDNDEFYELLVQ